MSRFIDIDGLNEQELLQLNARIAERVNSLREERILTQMMKFDVGDRVVFHAADGREIRGAVLRFNRKTVAIAGDDGVQWKVSPGFLQKCANASSAGIPSDSLIELPELFDGHR